jgi:hypothetical protein
LHREKAASSSARRQMSRPQPGNGYASKDRQVREEMVERLRSYEFNVKHLISGS